MFGFNVSQPHRYTVNYYFRKDPNSSRTRTTLTGSVSQHLYGATTENAVLTYLKTKHVGYEVIIMRLIWS